jgi:hypothetical protein
MRVQVPLRAEEKILRRISGADRPTERILSKEIEDSLDLIPTGAAHRDRKAEADFVVKYQGKSESALLANLWLY